MSLLLDWVRGNKQKKIISPREKFFGSKALNFMIEAKSEENVYMKFLPSNTILKLEYWRFEEAIKFLENKNDVQIGARLKTKKSTSLSSSLEEHLNTIAMRKHNRASDTKTAPYVCDLLVLSGIAEYVWTKSDIGRSVQGIRTRYNGRSTAD